VNTLLNMIDMYKSPESIVMVLDNPYYVNDPARETSGAAESVSGVETIPAMRFIVLVIGAGLRKTGNS